MPIKVQEAEFRAVYEEWRVGRLTQAEAAAQLEMGVRTFGRYVARFRTHGSQWWKDRSRHRPSSRRAPDEERANLHALYTGRYPGWNVRHFYERYRDEHGGERSYTWVKDVLQTAGLVEKRTRNGTPQRLSGMDAQNSSGRMPREGMLIHLIAARHEWVPGCTWDLVLTMDDASNRVYSGLFVEEVGIWSVLKGIRQTLEKGLFRRLSLPWASPARLRASESTFGGRTKPQLARVMSELGIDMLAPDRGLGARRRRMIGTLRGRLTPELAAEGIAEIGRANGYLPRCWTRINESLGKPTESPSAFAPLEPSELSGLGDVLCLKHAAQVSNGNRLFCKGRELELSSHGQEQLLKNRDYRIHECEDGSSRVWSRKKSGVAVVWCPVNVASRSQRSLRPAASPR